VGSYLAAPSDIIFFFFFFFAPPLLQGCPIASFHTLIMDFCPSYAASFSQKSNIIFPIPYPRSLCDKAGITITVIIDVGVCVCVCVCMWASAGVCGRVWVCVVCVWVFAFAHIHLATLKTHHASKSTRLAGNSTRKKTCGVISTSVLATAYACDCCVDKMSSSHKEVRWSHSDRIYYRSLGLYGCSHS
jgi:hypothetical protein